MASPGLAKGDFVPLPVTQFQKAYVTVVRSVAGLLPPDPTFPSIIFDAVSGKPQPYPDTAMHRAWYAGGKLFTDEAERMSFYWRINSVMKLTDQPKYRKYIDHETGTMHIALLVAVATVRFSRRTKAKALRATFDAEFRRRLAATVNPGEEKHAVMNVLGCQAPDVRDCKLFSFVTTESHAVVEPIHNKAMPVLLATAADVECWPEGTRAEALALQKAMPDDVVELVPERSKRSKVIHNQIGRTWAFVASGGRTRLNSIRSGRPTMMINRRTALQGGLVATLATSLGGRSAAAQQDITFFRIGTGGTAGTYFPSVA